MARNSRNAILKRTVNFLANLNFKFKKNEGLYKESEGNESNLQIIGYNVILKSLKDSIDSVQLDIQWAKNLERLHHHI